MADVIYRQEAIDALNKWERAYNWDETCLEDREKVYAPSEVIEDLPDVEPEIVRCKDCEWWDRIDDGPYGYCFYCKHGFYSANWEISIYRRYKEDFFCADGERRTDECPVPVYDRYIQGTI